MNTNSELSQPALPRSELQKLAYRVDEAVQASGLGKTTLYGLMKNGRLPSIMVAGRRLILRDDLDGFLRSCAGNGR